jgi:hypothetical protein
VLLDVIYSTSGRVSGFWLVHYLLVCITTDRVVGLLFGDGRDGFRVILIALDAESAVDQRRRYKHPVHTCLDASSTFGD